MVTIVDRTGEQQEFKYDQRVYEFPKDKATGKRKSTLVIPLDVATWLFRFADAHVHTVDGEFVRRYGVVDAPEDWVAEIGAEVLETSSLTRDTTRVEGWDAEAVRTASATVMDLNKTPNRPRKGDYINQGAAGGATVGG